MAFSIDCTRFLGGGSAQPNIMGSTKGRRVVKQLLLKLAVTTSYGSGIVTSVMWVQCNINIWDSSKLLQSLHHGTFEKNDFSFEVGSQVFNKLWFKVDGIYPELAHFVKTISEPLNKWKALYSI